LLKSAWEGLTLAFQNSNGTIKKTIDQLTKLLGVVQRLLFPQETATANFADAFTKQFENVLKSVKDQATGMEVINQMVWDRQKKYLQAYENLENASPFNAQKRAKELDAAKAEWQGALQAQKTILAMVDEQNQERERAAAAAAEEAARKAEELDKEQKKAIEAAKKQRIADLRAVVESVELEMSVTEAGTEKMLELRQSKIEAQRQLELEQNRQKVATERQDEIAINAKYDKMLLDDEKAFNAEVAKLTVQRLQAEQQAIQLEIAITEDGTEEMLALRLANLKKQEEIELAQNAQKDEKIRQSEAAIRAKYQRLALKETADFNNKLAQRDMDAARELAAAEFDLLDKNERQKTLFRLQQEKARLLDILKLNETATKKLTDDEIKAIKKTIEGIEKETARLGYNNLWELLGISLDSDQQSAIETAIDSVKDSVDSLADSWVRAAEAAVDAADAQVDAAQRALDAELEARNAGYANSVETARKELELAKSKQAAALAEQQKAQRAQARLDSLAQASSLVTASANIWKAFGGMGLPGIAIALASIGTMWGSFAAAKIKAAQVTTEQYGQGTVELLQGGSHASGHDIDLGTKPDGTRRRAEGGEYFAVINRRNSRRYGSIIPDVINSLNNGTFAERYQRANAAMAGAAIGMVDVSGIGRDVAAIRRRGDESRYVDGKGNTIIQYRNLTRKIKS